VSLSNQCQKWRLMRQLVQARLLLLVALLLLMRQCRRQRSKREGAQEL
jgi:hypothetical protein